MSSLQRASSSWRAGIVLDATGDGQRASVAGFCSEEMFVRLMSAFYVEIFDPCWGRNDLLWPTLRAAVGGADSGKG